MARSPFMRWPGWSIPRCRSRSPTMSCRRPRARAGRLGSATGTAARRGSRGTVRNPLACRAGGPRQGLGVGSAIRGLPDARNSRSSSTRSRSVFFPTRRRSPQARERRGCDAEFVGANGPAEHPASVAERVARLSRSAPLDDRADRRGGLLWQDVAGRAAAPALDELGLDDAPGLDGVGELRRFPVRYSSAILAMDACCRRRSVARWRASSTLGSMPFPISSSQRRLFSRACSRVSSPTSPSARRVGFLGWSGYRVISTKFR